ncbi:Hypothetical protein mma_2911 [Janthinobacterium sp. Marseille]|nr:hypothetical protein [Janthinobacterium sp. Marseille]ABR90628.1 Hypothetical protein mma_2911 [Janthinobacterium sp. Marseille]
MQSFTSIYKYSLLTPVRQSWVLSCAASVLLTLVATHVEPVQAQDVQGIDVDLGRAMQKQPPGQQGGQQSGGQRTPIPLSDSALLRITNLLKNLTPAGRDILLSKTYTPEERQQILGYMQSQTKQQEVALQPQPQELTLEQRRQLMSAPQSEMTQQQAVPEQVKKTEQLTMEQQKLPSKTLQQQEQLKEEIKKTETLTPEQRKQLLLTQQLEQKKQLEQVQPEQAKEQIKQVEKPTLEQQKQLLLTQQLEQQKLMEKTQQQQLKEEIRQVEKPALEQPKQILPTKQTSLPATTPASPASTAQEKYQKLLEAGVFSSSSGTTPVLDATMTRAQFAMIAAKLQELAVKSGGKFSDIPSLPWGELGVAQTAGMIEGISKPSLTVVSDDKKTSADFMELLTAYSKGKLSQAELDQLIAKIGSINPPVGQTTAPVKSDAPILGANKAVEQIVTPPGGTAVVATGIAGITAGGLTAIQAALAAAQAAAIAASSNANNITLANAVTVGADYTVVTPRANFPTNLNATFNGRMTGTLSDNSAVGANLSMNVNFANIGNGTPIGGNVQFDNNKGSASFNSVAYIGGYVGGGMSGTYNGAAMNGFIRNGQFFGPAANAVKGSWDMTTNSVSGGGSFAATR